MMHRFAWEPAIFSLYGRMALILFTLGFGAFQIAQGRATPGAIWLAAAVLLVYGYVRHGTVWLAFRALRAGNSKRAEALLDQIAFPDWLQSQHRAYYEFFRGTLAAARDDWEAARGHLATALKHKLRTDNDRSMVECVFAAALLCTGDRPGAREHLELARSYDHKPEVDVEIRKVEEMLDGKG
jgi:hypothetical protein